MIKRQVPPPPLSRRVVVAILAGLVLLELFLTGVAVLTEHVVHVGSDVDGDSSWLGPTLQLLISD